MLHPVGILRIIPNQEKIQNFLLKWPLAGFTPFENKMIINDSGTG